MKQLLKLTFITAMFGACGTGDDKATRPDRGLQLQPDGGFSDTPIEGSSHYRGFQEVDRALVQRLLNDESKSGRVMALRHVPAQLTQLLGRQTGTGIQSEFSNGDPNPLNMMIWTVAMKGLGQDLAGVCREEPETEEIAADLDLVRSRLSKSTIRTLTTLCAWNDESLDRDSAMKDLWHLLVGFEIPTAERAAWTIFFSSQEFLEQPATIAIESMVIGALLSPYFLLDQ